MMPMCRLLLPAPPRCLPLAAAGALRPVGLLGLERGSGADGRDQPVSWGCAPAARRAAARLLACAESGVSAHQRRADDRVAPLARGCHLYRSRRGPGRDRRGTDVSIDAQGISVTTTEQEDVEEDDTAFEASLLIKPPALPGVSDAGATPAKGSSPRHTELTIAESCTRLHTISIT